MKHWIPRALEFLEYSLTPIPQELNEVDWKDGISPNNDKLTHHLSAFANYQGGGYIVFGIDKNGAIKGIEQYDVNDIVERLTGIGRTKLEPFVSIDHAIELYKNIPLLFVSINESAVKPVHIKGSSIEDTYIRTGGTTRKASRQEVGALMLNSKQLHFEELHASKMKTAIEILESINYKSICTLSKKRLPTNHIEIIDWMRDEKMLQQVDKDGYYITNFGALAAAKNINEFDGIKRKTIRLVKYKGLTKQNAEREIMGQKGYAVGFEGLIKYLKLLLPSSEIIKNALRAETTVYPEIALRELIANALIHQDFTISGTGPMIEIFDDRIEISNPGKLLPTKRIDRLIRTTPQSRNEILAAAFRRYSICEERGSGFEKAVAAIELFGLPPLKFEEVDNSFRVTMYSPKTFGQMRPEERIEACYQHSIIRYYSSGAMTNSSLRERFKMHERQRPQISLVIKDAIDTGKIKPKDIENVSSKFSEYIPYWG